MKILRTANLGSDFTGSYKKSVKIEGFCHNELPVARIL